MKTPYYSIRFTIISILFLSAIFNLGCSKDDSPPQTPMAIIEPTLEQEEEIVLSSEKQMTDFRFVGIESNGFTLEITGEIDEQGKTIAIELPSGTEITALEPNLEIPDKAVFEPTGPQDFSTPINYTITAEDGTSRTYLVTVNVALSQKEILLIISDANPNNLLDWNETDNLRDWNEVVLNDNGRITQLNLNNKQLTTVPPEIGQLNSLKVLRFGLDNLSTLPSEIGQLNNLEELFLIECNLSDIPSEIGQLNNLKELDLSFNNLSGLPPEIGQLGSLEELVLRGNDLISLPSEFTQLVNLGRLDLSNNDLSEFNHVPFIPTGGIINLLDCATETNLKILDLSGNPNLEEVNQCVCDLDLDNGGTVNIDIVPEDVSCVANNVIGD